MKVTFTLTTAEARRQFWRPWLHRVPRRLLGLCAVPVISYAVASASGAGMLFSRIALAVTAVVPFAGLLLLAKDGVRQWGAVRAAMRPRTAAISRFDFFWGAAGGPGYHHHWTYFGEIADGGDHLAFVLNDGRRFVIPMSAFDGDAHARAFLTQARQHWEAAKFNAAHTSSQEDGVWPPPPRIGAG
jgi:hypothetical protein